VKSDGDRSRVMIEWRTLQVRKWCFQLIPLPSEYNQCQRGRSDGEKPRMGCMRPQVDPRSFVGRWMGFGFCSSGTNRSLRACCCDGVGWRRTLYMAMCRVYDANGYAVIYWCVFTARDVMYVVYQSLCHQRCCFPYMQLRLRACPTEAGIR
jgi:hypothetical protein